MEGVGFRADKEFTNSVRNVPVYFERHRRQHSADVHLPSMEAVLTEHCRQYGYFTVNTLREQFGLTKYKASLLANRLVSEPYAKFTRYKEGTTYHYRRVGV